MVLVCLLTASLELLTGVVAEHLFDLKLDRLDLV